MAFKSQVYQVLICSPSDVQEERDIIENTAHAFNALHAHDMKTVLLPVRWETHTSPEMGDRPQAIINKQIVEDSDILVAVFWARIGTPTGVAESGSVEEIKEFMAKGKPVLLYFSDAPVALASVDQEQYKRLTEFKQEYKQKGLIECYSDREQFSEKLYPALVRTVRSMNAAILSANNNTDAPETESVARPSAAGVDIPSPLDVLGLPGTISISSFNLDLNRFVRELEIEWSAERDSNPVNTDEGKAILRKADRKLITLRSNPAVYEHSDIAGGLDEVLRSFRALQRHRLYIDGGKSFREFWELGSNTVNKLKSISEQVLGIARKQTGV